MTDAELQKLINIPKTLSIKGAKKLIDRKIEKAFLRADIELLSDSEHSFFIRSRESLDDPTNFSVILSVKLKTGESFNLLRCNGSSHWHKNGIEKTLIHGTHVHKTTERYFNMGYKPEGFAEESTEYTDVNGATEHIMKLGNITLERFHDDARLF